MSLFSNGPATLICGGSRVPEFNLACEEYFLRQRTGSFILLWRNSPAIIIGRNQNAWAELDTDYAERRGIAVIRRLTGGGAVYHDSGNLCFSFIKDADGGMADFREALAPVTGYLRSLGLDADFSGRNDILLGGMKISGSAQATLDRRTLLHGTLLFSSSLDVLSRALKPNPLKLAGKGIRSVRSRVTNISEHLPGVDFEEFSRGLADFLEETEGCSRAALSDADIAAIEVLARGKYSTREWNFGAAPAYSVENSVRLACGILTAYFDVRGGRLLNVRLCGDFFGDGEISELERALCSVPHSRDAVAAALTSAGADSFIFGAAAEEIAEVFFARGTAE